MQLQVMNAMAQQQQLTRCVQKVLQSDGSTIPNGLTLHNGSLTNGEVPSLSTITQVHTTHTHTNTRVRTHAHHTTHFVYKQDKITLKRLEKIIIHIVIYITFS